MRAANIACMDDGVDSSEGYAEPRVKVAVGVRDEADAHGEE